MRPRQRFISLLALSGAAAARAPVPRPAYYFAGKTAEADPILWGLAWTNSHSPDRGELRHGAYDHHGLQKWGWASHDANGFGVEHIGDEVNNLNLTIQYVERRHDALGSCVSWDTRIIGELANAEAPGGKVSVFSYLAAGHGVFAIDRHGDGSSDILVGARPATDAVVESTNVQRMALIVDQGRSNAPAYEDEPFSAHVGVRLEPDFTWNLDEVVHSALWANWHEQSNARKAAKEAGAPVPDHPIVPVLNNSIAQPSNLLIMQHLLRVPFQLTWSYVDGACAAAVGLDLEEEDKHLSQEHDSETLAADGLVDGDWALTVREALTHLDVSQHSADDDVTDSVDRITKAAALREEAYKASLCSTLGLCDGIIPSNKLHVARHALGNLLGSHTFFYGPQLVAIPGWYETTQPLTLISGCPSRSFFPRGFLWDEGFHQLITSQVNPHLSLKVIASWFSTMDEDGWIARELIAGEEARNRVHPDFWVQFRDHPNPPTLFLALTALAVDGLCHGHVHRSNGADGSELAIGADGSQARLLQAAAWGLGDVDATAVDSFCEAHVYEQSVDYSSCTIACRKQKAAGSSSGDVMSPHAPSGGDVSPAEMLAYVRTMYPLLARHYAWFKRTQAGPRPDTFRWRGSRKGGHKLVWHHFASGLDDYPRGLQADERDEHVDLLGWMTTAARLMSDFAALAGDGEVAAQYADDARRYVGRLDEYWNETEGSFCEVGVAGFEPPTSDNNNSSNETESGSDADHRGTPVIGHVCHKGYVALFPLLMRMVDPASPRLGAMLDILSDPLHLWSPFGLRALSASDPLYGTELSFEEDYWRSSVWVNMNYLAVAALRYYADAPGPYAERAGALADRLSLAMADTVVNEYDRTGFLWEHFRSMDGKGRGTHPFTGWTALVALLIAQWYPL